MPAFNTIKVGDVLYSVYRRKMGNTTMSCTEYDEHKVVEIDPARYRVRWVQPWENETAKGRWEYAGETSKWRRSPPRCDDPFMPAEERAKVDARNGLKPRVKRSARGGK